MDQELIQRRIEVRIKKINKSGYIQHSPDRFLTPSKQYYVRYKGSNNFYIGQFFKGSELKQIRI